MKRPKFKIWDKLNKCWYEPVHKAYKGNLHELMIGMSGDLFDHRITGVVHESLFPDRYEVVQFTGLYDKKGIEIFMGDIVDIYETDERSTMFDFILYSKCLVDFKAGSFCYRIPVQMGTNNDGRESFPMYLESTRDIIVVGNIYENPEFLHP